MAKVTKTVHVDVEGTNPSYSGKQLVQAYGGKVTAEYTGPAFVCARVPRTRVAHLKGTATKKGLTVTIYGE